MAMPPTRARQRVSPPRRAAVPVLALAAALLAAPMAVSLTAPAGAQENDLLIHKKKEAREKKEQRIERNLRMREEWQGKSPADGGVRKSPALPPPPQLEDRTREDR